MMVGRHVVTARNLMGPGQNSSAPKDVKIIFSILILDVAV